VATQACRLYVRRFEKDGTLVLHSVPKMTRQMIQHANMASSHRHTCALSARLLWRECAEVAVQKIGGAFEADELHGIERE
jgi:hypothetical protein